MIKINDINNKLTFDMSVEAFVASMMECFGDDFASPQQFLIAPKGHLTRVLHKEVELVSEPFYDDDDLQYLNIQINREGLYDTLPANVFIDVDPTLETNSEKAIQIAKQVEAARKFFLPFEQILYQTRIDIELKEREIEESPDTYLALLFADIVKVEKECNGLDEKILAKRRRGLAYVLPYLDTILTNDSLKSQVLTGILGHKVTINYLPPRWISIPEEWQSKMGHDTTLGSDIVMGKVFKDGVPVIELTIELDDFTKTSLWLQKGAERIYFDKVIYPLFFPADTSFDFNIYIPENKRSYSLADDQNALYMGYSAYI